MPADFERTYLGDGVYVSFDGYMILLETERERGTERIYLEPEVWDQLVRYAATLGSGNAE